MGIRFYCPNGHKLNVKSFLAGKRGKCPECDARFQIPNESTNQPVAASQAKELVGAAATTNAVEVKSQAPKTNQLPLPESKEAVISSAAVNDPISESPDAHWYVRTDAGAQFGPANGELMREWIAEGRVPRTALVWRQGWNDWLNAGQVFAAELKRGGSGGESITPSIDTISTAAPRFRQAKKKRSSTTIVVLLLVACIVLFSVLLFVVFK